MIIIMSLSRSQFGISNIGVNVGNLICIHYPFTWMWLEIRNNIRLAIGKVIVVWILTVEEGILSGKIARLDHIFDWYSRWRCNHIHYLWIYLQTNIHPCRLFQQALFLFYLKFVYISFDFFSFYKGNQEFYFQSEIKHRIFFPRGWMSFPNCLK